jgi:hypothetical protein
MRLEIFEEQYYDVADLIGYYPLNITYSGHRHALGTQYRTQSDVQYIARDKDYWSAPVYAYVHGGATISLSPFSDPWDSGQSGVIYGSKDQLAKDAGHKKWCAATAKFAQKLAQAVVQEFDLILKGEVYGYAIFDNANEMIDSCHCFVGREHAEEAGRDALASYN